MFGFVGCGMIGPVSQPGPLRQSASVVRDRRWLEMMTVLLSCCAP